MFPPLDEVYPRLVPVHGVQHDLKPDEKKDRKKCMYNATLRHFEVLASWTLPRYSHLSVYRLLYFTILNVLYKVTVISMVYSIILV
jgi:hypothetical protein